MNVLVIDIGGTHIKFRTQRRTTPERMNSGPDITPQRMMEAIKEQTADWNYDRVSIGYPGPVVHNKPLRDPAHLGAGWKGFSFEKAFGSKPLRMINDAAMQALGSYKGRSMLFLGLGTGLGSAMIVDGVIEAMELAHLPWKKGKTYEDFLSERRLKQRGRSEWSKNVLDAVDDLRTALECDYVVLGGGNAKLVKHLPSGVTLGSNDNAFKGGFLIWDKKRSHLR